MRPQQQVFWLSVQETLEYRFDFFMRTAKYAVMIALLSFVWLAVGNEGDLQFNQTQTVQYFFLAALVYSASNFHPFELEEDIRLGGLSKYLTKPMSPYSYHFWRLGAQVMLETLLKIVVILPLLFLIGYALPFSVPHILLFLFYLPFIFWFAFHQLTIVSLISFWITESWAIRWSMSSIFRLLSGLLIPIAFFPETIKNVMLMLPYPHLAYTPIMLVQQSISLTQAVYSLGILFFWCIAIWFIKEIIWYQGLKVYESNGG